VAPAATNYSHMFSKWDVLWQWLFQCFSTTLRTTQTIYDTNKIVI